MAILLLIFSFNLYAQNNIFEWDLIELIDTSCSMSLSGIGHDTSYFQSDKLLVNIDIKKDFLPYIDRIEMKCFKQ